MAVNLATSTNYDPEYSRTKVISSTLNPSDNSYTPDFFSIRYRRLINNISSVGIGNITAKPITSLAYKYYSNTTCWWLIALINGFGNPLAISPETLISLPDISVLSKIDDISNTINLNQSNVTI